MLPRVQAALTQFIKPLSTGIGKLATQKEGASQNQEFKRQRKSDLKVVDQPQGDAPPKQEAAQEGPLGSKEKPKLSVVPATQTPSVPAPIAAPGTPSVASAFLLLLDFVQKHRNVLLTWFGKQTYRRALRGQKKGSRFAKGAMLDHKVE